jgi:hypothetical protein
MYQADGEDAYAGCSGDSRFTCRRGSLPLDRCTAAGATRLDGVDSTRHPDGRPSRVTFLDRLPAWCPSSSAARTLLPTMPAPSAREIHPTHAAHVHLRSRCPRALRSHSCASVRTAGAAAIEPHQWPRGGVIWKGSLTDGRMDVRIFPALDALGRHVILVCIWPQNSTARASNSPMIARCSTDGLQRSN